MNGGVEIGDRYRPFDNRLGLLVGDTDGTLCFKPPPIKTSEKVLD